MAQVLGVGDPVAGWTCEDQFGEPRTLDGSERLLLFAADRAGSKLAEAVLADWDGPRMEAAGIRYIADMSGMPAPITTLFALPALRKLPYPVLLMPAQGDAETPLRLPHRAEHVSLLRIDDGRVGRIRYFADAASLRQALPR